MIRGQSYTIKQNSKTLMTFNFQRLGQSKIAGGSLPKTTLRQLYTVK